MKDVLQTCLVGYGRIAQGLSDDLKMENTLGPLHTHYDVLFEHPGYHMRGIVERDWESWDRDWSRDDVDTVVITTPPGNRLEILKTFPRVTRALIEKPLGNEAEELVTYCQKRGIKLQVNYWRRADRTFRYLANGGLKDVIGEPQATVGWYSRELHHLINTAQFLGVYPTYKFISGDPYREVSLDIWGSSGRLWIGQELQTITLFEKAPCRSLDGDWHEIASDVPSQWPENTLNRALWRMYTGLWKGISLCSGEEALKTEVRVRLEEGYRSV